MSSLPTRNWPRHDATDEARLHREFLDFLRTTVVTKATGLTITATTDTPLPGSPTVSVLGIVKHLTAVERHWLTRTAGGSDLPALWEPDDVHAEWRLRPADTPSAVLAAYRAEWVHATTALEGLDPGDRARGDADRTVRWILAHVTQETARHLGHLDILRELADGQTGE